jgi:hypothetical protein
MSPMTVATSIVALFVTVLSLIAAINVYPQLRGSYVEDVADLVVVYGAFALFLLWIETPLDASLDEPGRPRMTNSEAGGAGRSPELRRRYRQSSLARSWAPGRHP